MAHKLELTQDAFDMVVDALVALTPDASWPAAKRQLRDDLLDAFAPYATPWPEEVDRS